jgi:hypothetical protein
LGTAAAASLSSLSLISHIFFLIRLILKINNKNLYKNGPSEQKGRNKKATTKNENKDEF